jgi:type VI secretion system protein ImpA
MMRDCELSPDAIDRLEKSVDAAVGTDGPSFGAARSELESLVLFIKPALKEAVPAPGATDVVVMGAARAPAADGPLQTRTQALAQLRAVADYFRRTEPHSPVAYLADKAAQWGEQPLHVWLRSVVKDDAAFAHIEEMLGVRTPPS